MGPDPSSIQWTLAERQRGLLCTVPFWLWGLDHDDSLWCPSMRLFRQKTRGDWRAVVERIARELADNSSP